MTDFQKRYLEEVGRRLHCQGFEVWPEYEGILPIEKDARRVCNVNVHGSVSYDPDYVRRNGQEDALDQVRSTAAETMTYMRQMAAAPPLLAEGLSGDYRLLAEFNYIVLAGHERDGGYGVEFVTWERIRDGTALWRGHYYDNNFTAAKQDFATRSGLIPSSLLFTPEQLAEVYRSIHETLDSSYTITAEREKRLRSTAEQIEDAVPDLEKRVELSNQAELLAGMDCSGNGMQLY